MGEKYLNPVPKVVDEKDSSAKEVTIDYLENIKSRYENAYLEWMHSDISDKTKLQTIVLAKEINALNKVILLVKENEGE